MTNNKHPIIAYGELYVKSTERKKAGGPKNYPKEYEIAKEKMVVDIDNIFHEIEEKKEIFLEEKVVCIRMETKFEAKSYVPTQLLSNDKMEIIGGRKYIYADEKNQKREAKLYFVKTDDKSIKELRDTLDSGTKDSIEEWRKHIRSIRSMDLLHPDEKIMGFPDDWEYGDVEIILHPLEKSHEEMIRLFYEVSEIPIESTKVKKYENGLTFISAKCNFKNLNNLSYFNPLRATHPLGKISINHSHSFIDNDMPLLHPSTSKSKIVVGVFDGGADDSHSLLNGHVKTTECVPTPPDNIDHGTAVCGAILHGNLEGKSSRDILPPPPVSIESFRVLPADRNDLELYETIDIIEDVATSRPDIKLYNLSFGPRGPIVDDSINRFTYSLDKLTYDLDAGDVNPLFCVAVGNDGDLEEDLNRIQSPADMVNGLAVGSYTYQADGLKTKAFYSCIGHGREGAKVKPDLLDFGGCDAYPFGSILGNTDPLDIIYGTSMATPCVVNKIGKLMARSENITPHLGRTLLIHNSIEDVRFSQKEQGHGYCSEDIEDILSCEDKKVTILYSGKLQAAQIVELPIFAPNINNVRGNVNISWTITTIVAPHATDPDAYTNDCIEDTFIPHGMTFNFSKTDSVTGKIKYKKTNLLKNPEAIKTLTDEGYQMSRFPISESPNHSCSESEMRTQDLKWDTVVKKHIRKRGSSLFNPSLVLHAIDRNNFNAQEIRYHVAITIEAQNYRDSLYDAILQEYRNLAPIEIRNINRILVDN